MKKIQSVEPNVTQISNDELNSYGLDFKLQQESLNDEIDKALEQHESKNGGKGGNRPDVKLLLQDKNLKRYPIFIEYKGYKDTLVKLDNNNRVENKTTKNEPNYDNIQKYAINGAVHYANAILHYTDYEGVIAIGVTGYKKIDGKIKRLIGVCYVSKDNFKVGQEITQYSDLSFLQKDKFDKFIAKINKTEKQLQDEKKEQEQEIDASLTKLNEDIYKNELGISEDDRVYLVAASIMASLGIPEKVEPLEKSDLKSLSEYNNTDGHIIIRKIESFLSQKNLPDSKKDLIIRTLQNTLLSDNINKEENGESQLKRIYSKIVDNLSKYYEEDLTTDFTGKLFNKMYSWLRFNRDQRNDVVLTPSYVANLLAKLARVDKDSYVWDFATGSAGLLIAAMNEMVIDAESKITSPNDLKQKILKIKTEQLLGIELLPNIYMLAILNMILMGDGSSNILNQDSLKEFDGKYGFGKTNESFPATAFILNPPYSAEGNGMIFVEKALSMMNKGYASIIIQNSAGSGKAKTINQEILKNNTLIASIKMPIDLFIGKSSVQTNIYVFKVGEPHLKDYIVKFIDFSNDGYSRTNRRKSSTNLKDKDRAKERYQELVDLVRFGKHKLKIFTEQEYYEGHIDPENGADWNQTTPTDNKPTLADFKKTVADYLSYEVSAILKNQNKVDDKIKK